MRTGDRGTRDRSENGASGRVPGVDGGLCVTDAGNGEPGDRTGNEAAGGNGVPDTPVTLVVDDDEGVVRTYREYLEGRCEVRTATDGRSALRALDGAVDVVLLDRRMDGLSGAETVEWIHASEHDPRVAVVTAVEPEVDVIGMGFDAYLTKPVRRDTLHRVVDRLLSQTAFDDTVRELYELHETRAALERHEPPEELESDEEYTDLLERIERLEAAVRKTGKGLEHEDFASLLCDLDWK